MEPNNLSRIENGKNYPTPENISKIATALNIQLYELFRFEHLKSITEIQKELEEIIKDEEKARLLYKFYMTLYL